MRLAHCALVLLTYLLKCTTGVRAGNRCIRRVQLHLQIQMLHSNAIPCMQLRTRELHVCHNYYFDTLGGGRGAGPRRVARVAPAADAITHPDSRAQRGSLAPCFASWRCAAEDRASRKKGGQTLEISQHRWCVCFLAFCPEHSEENCTPTC